MLTQVWLSHLGRGGRLERREGTGRARRQDIRHPSRGDGLRVWHTRDSGRLALY